MDQQLARFTRLDGTGGTNAFPASAAITVVVPTMPNKANPVLLIFHSNGQLHGISRTMIGVNAHHHVIVKAP
ncbi:MAG: hypothetical protein ABI212_14765 [Burkholderiaceae bacterium]